MAGAPLRVKLASGQEVDVVVPAGLRPGDTFRIALQTGGGGGDATVLDRLGQKGLQNVVRWYNFWKPKGLVAPPSAASRNLAQLQARLNWQNKGQEPSGHTRLVIAPHPRFWVTHPRDCISTPRVGFRFRLSHPPGRSG